MKKYCSKCKKTFYVLESWSNPPIDCEFCRVRAINDPIGKLQFFLKQRKSVKLTPSEGVFYNIWIQDIKLSKYVDSVINEKGKKNKKEILKEIIHVKRARKIIILVDKQSKIQRKRKKKRTMPSKITNIVQGGLPSLGKRSK